MSNPLLNFDQLPRFSEILPEHVVPAVEWVLQDSRDQIERLSEIKVPSWHNFAQAMEDIDERIGRVWSPVSHLNSVQDSDQLRTAYEKGLELLTEYHSSVGQNQAIFGQYKRLKASEEFAELSSSRQKVINNNLLDFILSGAELSSGDQQRFRQIDQELSSLNTAFERNLLDATQAWSLLITDESRLAGLPPSALDAAAQSAASESKDGWLFNLQIPSYLAVMQHLNDEPLRREMYQAYVKRASELSDNCDFDNSPIIDQILRLRHEKAELLGYAHYAEYSLVKKMAKSSEAVLQFLEDLASHARPVAEQELSELRAFALEHYGLEELQAWDISFYSERLREHRYAFSDEEIRSYLPSTTVFAGLFEIMRRLFNIEIVANTDMETWHEDVRCFDLMIVDSDGNPGNQPIGRVYTDLYVRKHKRGGAWMDTCIHRRQLKDKLQIPVAYLTCNFTPPIADMPALLTHDEVETLFHEFGHGLHHLLTEVDEMSVAGINGVAWDAVELPSQFLENWCWQEQGLELIAQHYQTGEPLPAELLQKMRAAKNFQSGMQTLRQVEFAMFDMCLHSQFDFADQQTSVQGLLDEIRDRVALFQTPAYNRFQHSFGHIFGGGYAAGYYSYKWAEVLSADAFERFEQEGIFNGQTGQDFLRAVLQRGGVEDAHDLFVEFRKRSPQIEALLRHSGLKQTGNLQ